MTRLQELERAERALRTVTRHVAARRRELTESILRHASEAPATVACERSVLAELDEIAGKLLVMGIDTRPAIELQRRAS